MDGVVDYYKSLTHASGLRPGICPHRLYRVPVKVLKKDSANGSESPVPGMSVSSTTTADMDVALQGYGAYAEDTTDAQGRANLFLPYVQGTRYALVANGSVGGIDVVGSARQPSDMRAGLNDEVKIYLEATNPTMVVAEAQWDADKENKEQSPFVAVVQMCTGSVGTWDVVGWSTLYNDAELMDRVSEGESGPYKWSHAWPKYSFVNGAYRLNEFRVLQLRPLEGPAERTWLQSDVGGPGNPHVLDVQSGTF